MKTTTKLNSLVQGELEPAAEFTKRVEEFCNNFEQRDYLVQEQIYFTAASSGRMTAIVQFVIEVEAVNINQPLNLEHPFKDPLLIQARFKGQDDKNYEHNNVYYLKLKKNIIIKNSLEHKEALKNPGLVEYGSVEAFLNNWFVL